MEKNFEKGKRGNRKSKPAKEKPEFDQFIVDLARVTRVTKGGKQLSFRACVLIGDRRGRVGYGVQKGKDVQFAVEKALNNAKKHMIMVPIVRETIPHRVEAKFKAAKIMLKPAPKGSGIIAGSVVRNVLELAGVPNASAKMLGKTNNKIANIKAVFSALERFKVRTKPVRPETLEDVAIAPNQAIEAVAEKVLPETEGVIAKNAAVRSPKRGTKS